MGHEWASTHEFCDTTLCHEVLLTLALVGSKDGGGGGVMCAAMYVCGWGWGGWERRR